MFSPRLEVEVEEDEGLTRDFFGGVESALHVTSGSFPNRDTSALVVFAKVRGFDDEGTGSGVTEVVVVDRTSRKGREGMLFEAAKVRLLEADEISGRDKIAESLPDEILSTLGLCVNTIKREAIDIVRNDMGGERERVRETRERERRRRGGGRGRGRERQIRRSVGPPSPRSARVRNTDKFLVESILRGKVLSDRSLTRERERGEGERGRNKEGGVMRGRRNA